MAKKKVHPILIKQIGGWSPGRDAHENYVQFDDEEMIEAVEKLDTVVSWRDLSTPAIASPASDHDKAVSR